jgi:hypothetical protein
MHALQCYIGSPEFIKISGMKWAGRVVRMEDGCPAKDVSGVPRMKKLQRTHIVDRM